MDAQHMHRHNVWPFSAYWWPCVPRVALRLLTPCSDDCNVHSSMGPITLSWPRLLRCRQPPTAFLHRAFLARCVLGSVRECPRKKKGPKDCPEKCSEMSKYLSCLRESSQSVLDAFGDTRWTQYFQRFRFQKGLATHSTQNTAKIIPQNCVLLLIRGHRKKTCRKRAGICGMGGISLRQPRLSANPFSKPLIFWTLRRPSPFGHTPRTPHSWGHSRTLTGIPKVLKVMRGKRSHRARNPEKFQSNEKVTLGVNPKVTRK